MMKRERKGSGESPRRGSGQGRGFRAKQGTAKPSRKEGTTRRKFNSNEKEEDFGKEKRGDLRERQGATKSFRKSDSPRRKFDSKESEDNSRRKSGFGKTLGAAKAFYKGDTPQRKNNSNENEQDFGRNKRERSFSRDKKNYSDKPDKKYLVRKSFKPKRRSDSEEVRLNRFLSNSGICSRREADEYIGAGLVSVDGVVVTELGTKVRLDADVRFNGERLKGENKVYVLLNKPKNYVTTLDDPQERKTVIDLVKNACKERIYPVGRLDRNTMGVLLLTNDGELTRNLTHPSFEKKKIYHVHLDKNVLHTDMQALLDGIVLEDGPVAADAIEYVNGKKSEVGIEIHSGKNRVIRRMFDHLGYQVIKLDRVYFAGLTKKNLRRGEWRMLTAKEVEMLKMGAYE